MKDSESERDKAIEGKRGAGGGGENREDKYSIY